MSASCPYCGSPAGTSIPDVPESMFGTGESFTYAECDGCRSLTLVDVPGDLSSYYPSSYYSMGSDPRAVFGSQARLAAARTLAVTTLRGPRGLAVAAARRSGREQLIRLAVMLDQVRTAARTLTPDTRILDVGCGSGHLLFLLELGGQRAAQGVDPFLPADSTVGRGVPLRSAHLASLEGPFDLVMFHHSLEHVPDPEQEVRTAMGLLAPGGRLLVRMPTCSSAAYQRYGRHWYQLDAPRHLSLPSREGVQALCDRLGLRIVHREDDSTSAQFWRSEEVARGLAMTPPREALQPDGSRMFTDAQLAAWDVEAQTVNAAGLGDQCVWVIDAGA